MRNRSSVPGLFALALLWGAAPLAAQEKAPPEFKFKTGAAELEFTGRFQMQAVSSSCSGFPLDPNQPCKNQVPVLNWFVRRARLATEITVNDRIEGKIQVDFGEVDNVELKDAWGRITLSQGAKLQFGHFKRPFDGFELTSSTKFLTIERDLDIPGVSSLTAASLDEFTTKFRLSDRDVGAMLTGSTKDKRFTYWLATFNGQGPLDNGDQNSQKQVIGRMQVKLNAGGLPLVLAGAGALTDRPFTRTTGELDGEFYGDFELWAELGNFKQGPHLQGEVILGDNPLQNPLGGAVNLAAGEDFATMNAFQVIGAYKARVHGSDLFEAIQPVFRVTRANPNTDLPDDEVWGFTPGIEIFFDGRNKLALNWDFVSFGDPTKNSVSSFKAQYQLHF